MKTEINRDSGAIIFKPSESEIKMQEYKTEIKRINKALCSLQREFKRQQRLIDILLEERNN